MIKENKEEKSSYLTRFLMEDQIGTVHSLFSHSFNIKLGKQLIHVSDTLEPLSAFGLKLTDDKLRSLLKSIQIGDFVSCQNQSLFFYNSFNKIILIIDLETLIEKNLKIEPLGAYPIRIEESLFFKELSTIPLRMRTGLPMSDHTATSLENLSGNVKRPLLIEEKSDIINHLLGRGIGLTPSGDDLLIGYTSILRLFNQHREWITIMRPLIKKGKTTDISLAYLNCLLEETVNENIKELIDLFFSKDQLLIQKKMKRMLLFGHTSGTDTLLGMLIGVCALINSGKKEGEKISLFRHNWEAENK